MAWWMFLLTTEDGTELDRTTNERVARRRLEDIYYEPPIAERRTVQLRTIDGELIAQIADGKYTEPVSADA